jgi:DNA recombination protein RmuC
MDVISLLVGVLTMVAGAIAGYAWARSGAAGTAAERDALRAERDRLAAERGDLDSRLRTAETQAARLAAALDHERDTSEALKDTFTALSSEALRENNKQFLETATAYLAKTGSELTGQFEQRRQAVEQMVGPMRESLVKVENQLSALDKDRVRTHESLMAEVNGMRATSEQLRVETRQLVTALRAPQVRGRWGEMQLRRVVEAAGMVEHVDFAEQVTVSSDGVSQRPDMVVRLAGGRQVVVDAKVAFSGYLEAMEARDEATKADRLKAHARHLRTHIDVLASKRYWEQFEFTPEFVVCFVPADVFLDAALDQEGTLLEHAFARNVVVATPSTLVALLRTVAYTWRQEQVAKNAQEIHRLAKDLYGRLAVMGGHFDRVGGQLDKAVKAYNEAVGSMESRVLVTARKLADLKVTSEHLATPMQVEKAPRQLQAPELVAAASEALVALPESESPRRTSTG